MRRAVVSPATLRYASEELRSNRDLVRFSVQHDGHSLCFAADWLRADRDVVMVAVQSTRGGHSAFEWAVAELRCDRRFVFDVVQECGLALEFASAELRDDWEVAMAAVQENAWALHCV